MNLTLLSPRVGVIGIRYDFTALCGLTSDKSLLIKAPQQ